MLTTVYEKDLYQIHLQAWTKCAHNADRARSAYKTSETHPIFRARTFYLIKNEKTIRLQVFSQVDKTMKELQ